MLRRLGGGSSLWRPKNPHSLEYLKYLHGVLVKNEKVTESNRKVLIEALRAISEILIWGDQNDSTVFDFFLERQMLSYFLRIMKQDEGGHVCVQLLQTLNILFENIRHETSLYFLLSNNHVNSIVTHRFDFSHDEIMAYYISFLKTLSFKLNPFTVHFFFNEATEDFPLLTESLKLFDHNESMVRIAVRNIFLNIVRVDDPAVHNFVKCASRAYVCEMVDGLVAAAIDLDVFVRSAENVQANRERLRDKVDDVVDSFHYCGELLSVECVAEALSSMLHSRLLSPLLLNSLVNRRHYQAVLLTPVTSFFYLSQFLFVVTYKPLIEQLLSAFLFEDISILTSQWVRSEDASYSLQACLPDGKHPTESHARVFFDALLCALESSAKDDYLTFYALLLVYAIFQNKGEVGDVLQAASIPTKDGSSTSCEPRILEALLETVSAASASEARLRPVTLELACLVLRQMVMVMDCNQSHDRIAAHALTVKAALTARLAGSVQGETLFLDMFEDEYGTTEQSHSLRLEQLAHELLLPPAASPMAGLPLNKRLPSGHEERIRTAIQLYLHVRRLEKDMRGEQETELPLRCSDQPVVANGDCINLNNADLLSCTVVCGRERVQRFLVTDRVQFILVEPDSKKAGWAVVKFVGLLQDTQLTGDKSDSRSLHVVIEGAARRGAERRPLLTAQLVFDDHIRCMAAKQRLTKGRDAARQLKMTAICELLGVQSRRQETHRTNPFRVMKGCAPGSVRKQVTSSPALSRSSQNSIPDDPCSTPVSANNVQQM